ncbi:hypothetical protein HYFRA_00001396 [Hymenoscyphus fraxineus]|uniref:Uncharacterized protein n=1 Tax=Hymenoscyphus fraxineus TaxID=746836 RepID=A0A9N9PZ98_9HELO|nr:hypothetical protein HYFRA_00001396 [Hymenoscyphus fraxineus]
MEGSQRPDINELLTQGFFTTSRAKSPSKSNFELPSRPGPSPSYLYAKHEPTYERSRSRGRRKQPPRPFVEDEVVSLARETLASSTPPSYDPPLRGIVDQIPIILEADVTKTEAARLQTDSVCKEIDKEENTERRFVVVPKSDTQSSGSSEDDRSRRKESRKKDTSRAANTDDRKRRDERKKSRSPPPLERRRSRQDLPSLQTKLPRSIPPPYRRSASSFAKSPNDNEVTPKATVAPPKGSGGEYFLSPDMLRRRDSESRKESVSSSASAPRYATSESYGSRNGSTSGYRSPSYSGTPITDPRDSRPPGPPRSRSNTNERSPRPKNLPKEHASGKMERRNSNYSNYSKRSTEDSAKPNRPSVYYTSSDDDLADSDSDEDMKRRTVESQRKRMPMERHNSSKSNRSSYDGKGSSTFKSPKVSPKQAPTTDDLEKIQTFPRSFSRRPGSRPVSPHSAVQSTPKGDKLNPSDTFPARSASVKASSNTPKQQFLPYPTTSTMPIPIAVKVNLQSSGETQKSPSTTYHEDKFNAKPSWQPGSFQPPQNLEKPVGSYRRFSEDVERGSIAPLPACPRMSHTRGCNDWLTLPNCPGFNICPSCYQAIIARTEFARYFVAAAPRPPDASVQCDFGSSPWYRIAWLLTLKEKRRDLDLFYGLADVAASEPPCLGKQEGIRKWHSIIDHKTGAPVYNFDVCYNCVRSIETLLPVMKGAFIRNDKSGGSLRICDLSVDSKRFVKYFDALEVTADRANRYDEEPDLRDLASLARRFGRFSECEKDKDRIDKKWYMITQLPEFTVCEECYEEVVWPEVDERKAIPLMFQKNMVRLPVASCQLYSPKMRGIFRIAVAANDYKLLASKARERKTVEKAYKANVAEVRRQAVLNPAAANQELRRLEEEWRRWE